MSRDSLTSISSSVSSGRPSLLTGMSKSTNKKTTIHVFDESGNKTGTFKPQINMMQKSLADFYKSIKLNLKTGPGSPNYDIQLIKICVGEKFVELDESNIRDVFQQISLFSEVKMKVTAIEVEEAKPRSASRLRSERPSTGSCDENSSINLRQASPLRCKMGTAPATKTMFDAHLKSSPVPTASASPIATSGRSVSASRGVTKKAALPIFRSPSTRNASPLQRRGATSSSSSQGPVMGRAQSAARVGARSSKTSTTTTPGGLTDRNVRRVKDRSSPKKTSPVKSVKTEAEESEAASATQKELPVSRFDSSASVSSVSVDQQASIDDTDSHQSLQSTAASRQNSCESIDPESAVVDTEGDSLSFEEDLPEGEEKPDMGRDTWRESMAGCSQRGGQIEKKLFKEDGDDDNDNGDGDKDETGAEDGLSEQVKAMQIDDEPVSESQDEPLESQEPTEEDIANDDEESVQSSQPKTPKAKSNLFKPTAASMSKVKERPSSKKKPRNSEKSNTLTRTQSTPQKSKSITISSTTPDGSTSFMAPTESNQHHFEKVEEDLTMRGGAKKWEDSLRKADSAPKRDKTKLTAREKARAYDPSASILKAMRADTKTLEPDGRPSLNTMSAQWEFMRDQFVNGDSENLEWAMMAKTGGEAAYKHAHKKASMATDQYYWAIYEISMVEVKKSSRIESGIKDIVQEIANCKTVLQTNPYDADSAAIIDNNIAQVEELLNGKLKGVFMKALDTGLKDMCKLHTDKLKCANKARFVIEHGFSADDKSLKERLQAAQTASDESLTEMEKWDTRVKQTSYYATVVQEEDAAWMMENAEKNTEALELMRSLIPMRVSEMSIAEIGEFVSSQDGLYTPELIQEIKTNKLLHWLVMHTDDIAFSNFLSGEYRQFFVNLEGLDVVELRALRMVIPDKFELDSDGQKAEWRERFLGRVKQLVAQENGDMVKGGWDADANRRSMIHLPELKQDQKRRPVYFFRTKAQMEKRLKQYVDKEIMLAKKEKMLEEATEVARDMKQEYDYILEESRIPENKVVYGAEKLAQAKDLAKRDHQNAERRKNELTLDVGRLKKTIASNPISHEQFIAFMEEQRSFLSNQNWEESEEALIIPGVCDRCPEIRKVERSAAKAMSAEEEAMQRKRELEKMSSGVGASVEVESAGGEEEEAKGDISETQPVSGEAPVNAYLSALNASKELDAAPPVTGRRTSVLLRAKPEVLNVLNSMFTGGSSRGTEGSTPIVSRRSSMSGTPFKSAGTPLKEGIADGAPVEPKPIRSKNLKRLLEMGDSAPSERPSMAAGRPQLSFLDQIKKKSEGASASAAAPPSLLDAIKARKKDIEE